jgi:predicted metal-dependent hydrolase
MTTQPLQLELFRLPPVVPSAAREHHIMLAGRIVPYALRRDRRRLAMRIDEQGLRVGAPHHLSLTEVEAFLRNHADWILEKLDTLSRRSMHRHLPIHEGTRLPVLGREIGVRVSIGNNRGLWEGDTLWLAARVGADLTALARRALQRRALEHFRPRLNDAVARLEQPLPTLALSAARTRWGSCSTKSGIRLNWRLIHLPPEPIDYVIAHEAAHLVEMNHSPRFWAVVERLYPDWRAARALLRQLGPELPRV